jgi:preprotein translocase subunit SecE
MMGQGVAGKGKEAVNWLKTGAMKVRLFFAEVNGEFQKTDWPVRQELIESTIVVLASVVLLSAFVGICDKVLITVLRLLIH